METILKVAPFFSTDTVVQAGFRLYRVSNGALVADGARNTSAVKTIPNVTNGYSVTLDDTLMTLDSDGGYRGMMVWDTGGSEPLYVMDEVYVLPTKQTVDLTQVIPTSNTAGTVGDALNAARAQGFGKWVKSGTTLTLYAADGITVVRTFTLNDANAPTQRV